MSIKLKILKTWINNDYTIIFQTSIIGPKDLNLPKKIHLLIDLRQQTFGMRLDSEKPGQATANHAFIQILRKHIPQFTIKEILRDKATGDQYIPLLSGPQGEGFWYIKLAFSKPPLASLVDPKETVQVSYGQKGTFTKKHQLDGKPDWSSFEDIFPALAAKLMDSAKSVEAADEDSDEEKIAGDDSNPIPEDQRELASRLKRKLKTTKKNLEKLRGDLPARSAVDVFKTKANYLQRYAYLVPFEAFELRLDATQTDDGMDWTIELDPDLSVGRNIEAAFEKARKMERKIKMGQEQIDQFQAYEKDLIEDIEILRSEAQSESFWQKIVAKYKLPDLNLKGSGSAATPVAKAYKSYLSSTGHMILVGKGAKENDILTKAARANDYWFHAVGVTGSHVIVPSAPDIRSALPSQLLKEAAMLAIHASRLKDDLAGECYVTKRASLKKQKGMAAGLWKIEQSETFFVRYKEEELQKILQSIRA
ncbi:MAG: DUF814 domain-containing protein [Proteobacteria bacterium]|nr:MAG: DUF814 domain-containing protein [Pseudomonadota bacterium]